MKRYNKNIIICFFLYPILIQAATIGSDTAVTRFNTSQVVSNGDRIAGFAALNAGFSFNNASTLGTFDSFFHVMGPVALNFGTLILGQDLVLDSPSSIAVAGNIIGAGHTAALAPNISVLAGSALLDSCAISFVNNAATAASVLGVDWNSSGQYVAVGLTNNAGNELSVYSWDGATLSLITGVNLAANTFAVSWHPTNNWIAVGRDGAAGAEIYNYSFNGVTLTLLSSIDLGGAGNGVRSVAWRPQGDFLAVGSDNNAAELRVYAVNGSGVFGASALVNLGQDVNAVSWNSAGTQLAAGLDSGADNELRVYLFAITPTLTLDSTFPVNQNVLACSWNKVSPNNEVIAIGVDAGTDRLQLYLHSTGSLTLIPSISIADTVNCLDWHPNGECLLAGLSNGTIYDLATYMFQNNVLSLNTSFELGTDVLSCAWSRGTGSYAVVGDAANTVDVYRVDANFVNMTAVRFSDLFLELHNNVTLRDTSITFSGRSAIAGFNNTLTLTETATLVVEAGASLLLQNITISNLKDSRLRLTDSVSTLSVQNVTFILEDDFTLTNGYLDILGECIITGSRAFNYQTNQTSIIRGSNVVNSAGDVKFFEGSLILDRILFNYNPPNNSSSLLNFESALSVLEIKSSILQATTLSLLKGSIFVDGQSGLYSSGSITLGSGVAANNIGFTLLPAATLDIRGTIINANV